VDFGLWVESVGGSFEVDVTRPDYGAWSASQVDSASGAQLRPVPMALVDTARGLRRFLSVRFIDSRGRLAARTLVTFCPNGESARVDANGPLNPTYPGDCGAAAFFPFVRGIVWGIDAGWAVAPALGNFPGFGPFGFFPPRGLPPFLLRRFGRGGINVRPGRYTAIVSITPEYQSLFAIPASQASATFHVRVLPTPVFRRHPPVRVVTSRPAARHASDRSASPGATQPGGTQANPATMPNLVALPAWRIGISHQGRRELLTFSATIWNAGPAPFTIDGIRRPNSKLMNAYEYFFDSAGNAVGSAPAGTMYYDNRRGHHHWHLAQLVAYELVGPSGQVVRSHKQSFCIAPTNAVDLTVPGADRSPLVFGGPGFGGSVCDLFSPNAIWLREQLPAGWGDTYTQSVAGQAFDITNLPNGRYQVDVQVNPLGVLTETTTADDLAVRVVRLSGPRGKRRATVAPWHGIRG
jgi:hypothetical protein